MTNAGFLDVEGIHNFRDYGGWAVPGGGRVRQGMLWRSGQHVGASEADLAVIAALDIRTVIDLRGSGERARNPCRRPDGFAAEVICHDGETSSSPPHMDIGEGVATEDYARERMIAVYTRMPSNPAMTAMFGRYFAALDRRDGASLVHCFAGKDRTGIAATLLLHVLGVSEADQRAEFLRTNDAPTLQVLVDQSLPAMEKRLGRSLDPDAMKAFLEVRGEYLDTFFAEVERSHGALDGYLAKAIGVDDAMRARLRTRFVT